MDYIACIAEGSAETAVIDILLNHELLIFNRNEMLDEKVLRCRSAVTFETRYLRKGFEGQITVYRVLDSRRENFRLSKAYAHKVSVINVVTAPEIEMLIILRENQYEEYKKNRLKPSEFCKAVLGYHDVKSYAFVSSYFSDPSDLLAAMKQYKEISRIPKGEWTLLDLVKPGIASEAISPKMKAFLQMEQLRKETSRYDVSEAQRALAMDEKYGTLSANQNVQLDAETD